MMRSGTVVAIVMAMGCSLSAPSEQSSDVVQKTAEEAPPMAAPVAEFKRSAKRAAFGGAPAGSAAKGGLADDAADRGGESADPAANTPTPAKRMVHYNGYCKLRVTEPQQVLARAVALAEQAEGYVENYSATSVTLRVPVASFQIIYDQVVKLGDVVARSITAQDVTDAFTAIELRLKTLRASRDRLISLLAKVRSEQEKLNLLREIRRLTETIDQLALQLDTIASLASFSRITVEAEPRHTDPGRGAEEVVGAFRWIRALSPFRRDVAGYEDELKLSAPEGMVALDSDSLWSAESADGAVIWAHRRDNRPLGDTSYWVNAIRERLSSDFAEATVEQVGDYSLLRLVDGGPEAYRYLIAVSARGEDLHVIEVYLPGAEHEKRHGAAVKAVIGKGGAS